MAIPRECVRCHEVRIICGRGLCSRCYRRISYEGRLEEFPKQNVRHKKRYDTCLDCGKHVHIYGHDRCKKCYMRWYEQKPSVKKRRAKRMQRWRLENPEKAKAIEDRRAQTAKRRRWQKRYNREYYQKHARRLRAYQVRWRQENPEQFKLYWQAAYARRKEAEGFVTSEQWAQIVDFYCPEGACPCCGEPFDESETSKKLTMDHVVPLNLGGSHYPENIQPLCFSCNSSKSDHSTKDYRPDKGTFAKELQSESLDGTTCRQVPK